MNIGIDNTLFHYTSLDTFMNHILPSKQLKLGKIIDSRDPYEYRAFKARLFEDDKLHEDIGFLDFLKAARNLKLNSQYLCLCMPNCKHIGDYYYMRWGYDRPKVWESYGDKHQGVCVAMNKDKLLSVFEGKRFCTRCGQLSHGEIVYKDIVCRSDALKHRSLKSYFREVGHFSQAAFLEEFKQEFFFQKDYDYQDENEYRLTYITSKVQEDMKIDISKSVNALYFGDKVESSFIEFYKELIKKEFPSIKLYQVQWFNGTAELRNI